MAMSRIEFKSNILKYGIYYVIRDALSNISYIDFSEGQFSEEEKELINKIRQSNELVELNQEELLKLRDTNFLIRLFEDIIFKYYNFSKISNIPKNIQNVVSIKGKNLIGVFDYESNLVELFVITKKSELVYNENEVFKNLFYQKSQFTIVPLDYYLGALLISETNLIDVVEDVQSFIDSFLDEFRNAELLIFKGEVSKKIVNSAKEKVFRSILNDSRSLIGMDSLLYLLFNFSNSPVSKQQLLNSYFYLLFETLAKKYELSILDYNSIKEKQKYIFNDVDLIKKFAKYICVTYDENENPIEIKIKDIVNKEPLKIKEIKSYINEPWFRNQVFSYLQQIKYLTDEYKFFFRLSFDKNIVDSFYHIISSENDPIKFLLLLSQLRDFIKRRLEKLGLTLEEFEELPLKSKIEVFDRDFFSKYLIYKAFYKYIEFLIREAKVLSLKPEYNEIKNYLRSYRFFYEYFKNAIVSINHTISKNVKISKEGSLVEAKIYHDYIEFHIPLNIQKEPIFEKLKTFFDTKIVSDKYVKVVVRIEQLFNSIKAESDLLKFFTPFLTSIFDDNSFFDIFISRDSISKSIRDSLLKTETNFAGKLTSNLSVRDIFYLIKNYENPLAGNYLNRDDIKLQAIVNYLKEKETDYIKKLLILKQEYENNILDIYTGSYDLEVTEKEEITTEKGEKLVKTKRTTKSIYEIFSSRGKEEDVISTFFYSFDDFKELLENRNNLDISKEIEEFEKEQEQLDEVV